VTDCGPASPPEQLGLIWNSHQNFFIVGRVAGRPGAIRAIAPSMPPDLSPWQGSRRPTQRFCGTGEVIDFALVVVYGLKQCSVGRVAGRAEAMRAVASSIPPHARPRHCRRRPTPRFCVAGERIDFSLVAIYEQKMVLFAHGRAAGGPRRGFMPQAQAA
jgi:hypothetical protein